MVSREDNEDRKWRKDADVVTGRSWVVLVRVGPRRPSQRFPAHEFPLQLKPHGCKGPRQTPRAVICSAKSAEHRLELSSRSLRVGVRLFAVCESRRPSETGAFKRLCGFTADVQRHE